MGWLTSLKDFLALFQKVLVGKICLKVGKFPLSPVSD